MQKKKKLLIIIACCLIWAAIIAYNLRAFVGGGAPQAHPDAQRTPGPRSGRAVSPDALPALRLDLLKKPRSRYSVVARDIFSPFKVEVAAPVVASPAPPPAPLPTPLETFASQVRFMGFLEKGEGKTVFIGMQSDIFMVRAGDRIAGKFKVVEITGSTMMLMDEGNNETVTIELQK